MAQYGSRHGNNEEARIYNAGLSAAIDQLPSKHSLQGWEGSCYMCLLHEYDGLS